MSNSKGQSSTPQRRVSDFVQSVDANRFFNLLTGPELLESVEATLPQHRERRYPPTVTLSMFLGQALNADGSCQKAVTEATVSRQVMGLDAGRIGTSGYCLARKRLPQEMVCTLARQAGKLLDKHTPEEWLWKARPVKLVDGTTVLMPDTEENQKCYPVSAKHSAPLQPWWSYAYFMFQGNKASIFSSVSAAAMCCNT